MADIKQLNKHEIGDYVNIRARITGIYISEDKYKYEVCPLLDIIPNGNRMLVEPPDIKNRIRKL